MPTRTGRAEQNILAQPLLLEEFHMHALELVVVDAQVTRSGDGILYPVCSKTESTKPIAMHTYILDLTGAQVTFVPSVDGLE